MLRILEASDRTADLLTSSGAASARRWIATPAIRSHGD
jgi:hypothetical protein